MEKRNRGILTISSPENRLAHFPKTVRKPIEGGWIQTEEAPVIDWGKAKVVTM